MSIDELIADAIAAWPLLAGGLLLLLLSSAVRTR